MYFDLDSPLAKTVARAIAAASFLSMFGLAQAQTTLITDVHGYTVNGQRELVTFSALQFTGATIDRVFAVDEPLPDTQGLTVIDGEGKTLIPGLIDAHGHILSYGLSLLRVDLTGTESEEEAVERIRAFQQANGNLEWIQGRGWNQVLWTAMSFPQLPVWMNTLEIPRSG